MKVVITKSLIAVIVAIVFSFLVRAFFKTDAYLPDVSGLSAFLTVFGTLYGIMSAFVVFEVWAQYNKTTNLIDQEALGLERLYRLTLYFRDKKLTDQMRAAIEHYIQVVVRDGFKKLGEGVRNEEASRAFRKIAAIVRDVKFDDDHDSIVYDHIIDHYGQLHETRTDRVSHSLMRLPFLLRFFLYATSIIAILTFIVMPFGNMWYGFFVAGTITFVIAMVLQLVEDLDNPFVGHWTITTTPFERALKHIEESY